MVCGTVLHQGATSEAAEKLTSRHVLKGTALAVPYKSFIFVTPREQKHRGDRAESESYARPDLPLN
jgi:hypothetical protein